MKEKWIPHIIAAWAVVFFIVLGLACASSPDSSMSVSTKLFEPKKVSGYLTMTIYSDDMIQLYIVKDKSLGNTLNEVCINQNWFRAVRQQLARERATPGVSLSVFYGVSEGPTKLIIDGITYSLEDFTYFKTDEYIYTGKISRLGDTEIAILNCSKLSINGKEIEPNGIAAIKEFFSQ